VFSPPKKKDEGDEDEEGVIVMGRMIGSSSFRTNSILSLTPPPSNLPVMNFDNQEGEIEKYEVKVKSIEKFG